MRIKIEPKAFFMYAVFLAFSKEHPHPEDEAIKAYLDAHELIPKVQGTDTFEDQAWDIMYFGGCYLGNHLEVIRDMQRQAVEHQLLTVDIERMLQETTVPATRRVADQTPADEGTHRHPGPGVPPRRLFRCQRGRVSEGDPRARRH